jgi:hypothetical protein
LRFEFAAKKVSLSSTSKGEEARNKVCAAVMSATEKTAFLTGSKDVYKRIDAKSKRRKK